MLSALILDNLLATNDVHAPWQALNVGAEIHPVEGINAVLLEVDVSVVGWAIPVASGTITTSLVTALPSLPLKSGGKTRFLVHLAKAYKTNLLRVKDN